MKSSVLKKAPIASKKSGQVARPLFLQSEYLALVESQKKQKQQALKQPKLKVYTSSPEQRFAAQLKAFTKTATNLALIGIIGSAFSYFASISLEFEVSKSLKNLEREMKNREDLKSYLSKAYSWQNLNAKADKLKFVEAKKIEVAQGQNSIYHLFFGDKN